MPAQSFALAHPSLARRGLVNTIISFAFLFFNTLFWARPQAASEPWLVLDEPSWLDVRAEAFEVQGPIRNPPHSHSDEPDEFGREITASSSDEELNDSDTSNPPYDDAGDCDWEDLLFERPPSSLGFRGDEEEGEFADTAVARAPCLDIGLEIDLVKPVSEPSKKTSIRQSHGRDGFGLIKEDEILGRIEGESDKGTSEPLASRWSFDSSEELDDGLIDPRSYEGEEVLTAIKRWLLLPRDLEPLTVLYRLSTLKDALCFLPNWIPKKTSLVRDELFMNLRSRDDVRHGNVLFLACLRRLRWDGLLSQIDQTDQAWIHGFLSALGSPRAPPTKRQPLFRIRGNSSRLGNVITAEYHIEAEASLAPSPATGDYGAEAADQRLQHGFWRISESVQRLDHTAWEILREAGDLEMRAAYLDARLGFLDANIEDALEDEEAVFGSWLARIQALQVQT